MKNYCGIALKGLNLDIPDIWDSLSPDNINVIFDTFIHESKLISEKWHDRKATSTERRAVTNFLVDIGALEIRAHQDEESKPTVTIHSKKQPRKASEHGNKLAGEGAESIKADGEVIPNAESQQNTKRCDKGEHKDENGTRILRWTGGDVESDDDTADWEPHPDEEDEAEDRVKVDGGSEIHQADPHLQQHECHVCNAMFNQPWELDLHRLSKCMPKLPSDHVYTCHLCDKIYKTKGKMSAHLCYVHDLPATEILEKVPSLLGPIRMKKRGKMKRLHAEGKREWRQTTIKREQIDVQNLVCGSQVYRQRRNLNKKYQRRGQTESKTAENSRLTRNGNETLECSRKGGNTKFLLQEQTSSSSHERRSEMEPRTRYQTRSSGKCVKDGGALSGSKNDVPEAEADALSPCKVTHSGLKLQESCPTTMAEEKRVLLVDNDKKSNTSIIVGVNKGNTAIPNSDVYVEKDRSPGKGYSDSCIDEGTDSNISNVLRNEHNLDEDLNYNSREKPGGSTCDLGMQRGQESNSNLTQEREEEVSLDMLPDNTPDEGGSVTNSQNKKRPRSKIDKTGICYFCGEKFKSQHLRKAHLKKVHFQDVFKCSTCNKEFVNKTYFMQHVKNHGKEKEPLEPKYKCSMCPKVFKVKHFHAKHEQDHKDHPDFPHQFKCHMCNATLLSKGSLKQHINYVHTKAVKYPCKQCDKVFYQKGKLANHMQDHIKGKTFKCDECEQMFYRKYDVEVHKRTVHVSPNQFLCDICGAAYKTKGNLKQHHMTAHTDDFRFSCTECGKKFKRTSLLNAHMRCHLDSRPFSCQVCGKGFRTSRNLSVHMDWHNNVRAHKCSQCDRAFLTKGNLDKHKRMHSKAKAHFCEECGHGFVDLTQLRNHLGKVHKINVPSKVTRGTSRNPDCRSKEDNSQQEVPDEGISCFSAETSMEPIAPSMSEAMEYSNCIPEILMSLSGAMEGQNTSCDVPVTIIIQ